MFSPEREFRNWKISAFAGAQTFLFETIDSTHSKMKQQAIAGEISAGTLFVADSQDAGRGRHDRTWASPAGKNLYFNILLPLEGIPQNRFAQITQIAALTFAEVFKNLGADVTVKWPNDILAGKSKFCGILSEIIFIPNGCEAGEFFLNMGVGINVNSEPEDYKNLNRDVTTLKAITNKVINREKLLQALISSLERALGQFKAFGISPWVNAWRQMDKFLGSRGTVIVNNHCTDENRNSGEGSIKKSGQILDMNPDGSLLFKTDDGETLTVYSADLEI
ncbi:MAG: biotin--[acetyl-CoA-carboxylase] ligase [Fibrobacter sp.]|nr:biotin--[acetyl-CoA-carboxylase] ligase [Fibrobacter sp.]